uniref:Uncharacterized protein n=1 Tax=Rhizophora mucronata TaxID=61149 RepID=A0A2P2II95_RHIMU
MPREPYSISRRGHLSGRIHLFLLRGIKLSILCLLKKVLILQFTSSCRHNLMYQLYSTLCHGYSIHVQ